MDIQPFMSRYRLLVASVFFMVLPILHAKAYNRQTHQSTDTLAKDTILSYTRPTKPTYVIKSRTLSYGSLLLIDTYISNMEYFGWNVGYESSLLGFYSHRIYWRSVATLNYGNTVNLPATSAMSYTGGEMGYGIGYNCHFDRLNLKIGALPAVGVGLKNNVRNINNSFSADAFFNLWLDLEAGYKIPFKRVKLVFTDHLQTSLFGGMFVPEFGALYYQYSLGNSYRMLHFSSLHNKVALKNRFEVSLALRKVILKAQYYINYQKWNTNNLYFAHIQHNFGLGLVMLLENTTAKF